MRIGISVTKQNPEFFIACLVMHAREGNRFRQALSGKIVGQWQKALTLTIKFCGGMDRCCEDQGGE